MENPFEIIDKRLTVNEGKLEALIQRIGNQAFLYKKVQNP